MFSPKNYVLNSYFRNLKRLSVIFCSAFAYFKRWRRLLERRHGTLNWRGRASWRQHHHIRITWLLLRLCCHSPDMGGWTMGHDGILSTPTCWEGQWKLHWGQWGCFTMESLRRLDRVRSTTDRSSTGDLPDNAGGSLPLLLHCEWFLKDTYKIILKRWMK